MDRVAATSRVVAGWDGRDGGYDALVLARLLAISLDADVVVVHIESGQPPERDAEADLEEAFASSPGPAPPLHTVRAQSPQSALRAIAAEPDVAALVVGSTHQAGWGKVRPGAVSERLLGTLDAPLVIAPRGFGGQPHDFADDAWLRVIEVALDGSAGSRVALDAAARVAETAKATVRVVAVEQPLPHDQLGAPATAAMAETQDDLRARLDEAVSSLPSELRALPIFERSNDPAGVIIDRAEQGVDLLAIGSRAHGHVGALLGGTARAIVRRAGCPVLVAPAPPDAEPP
jgi:nucleotide-binding universal stress UspA family protein